MPAANLLDVLGSRWALHILMALADRPMRFTDLRLALPAIGAKVLTVRLRELEGAALIARLPLAQPASGQVYVLSRQAEGLRPALAQISLWTSATLTGAPC